MSPASCDATSAGHGQFLIVDGVIPMFELLDVPAGLALSDPAALVSTWFGAGLLAPLRAGLAVATAFGLALLLRRRGVLPALTVAVALAAFVAIGAWEDATGTRDDRRIVVDEVLGFLVAASVLGAARWRRLAVAAPVFLALDRWKPWPFDWLETLPGAVGVLADDAGAGLAAALAILAACRLWRGGLR